MAAQGNDNKNGYTGTNKSGNWFNLSNDGTVMIDIEGYASSSIFTTQTENAHILPNHFFQFYANFSASGTANTTRGNVPGTFATRTKLVTNLGNYHGKNNALVGVSVEVPSDESAGRKKANIYFIAQVTG